MMAREITNLLQNEYSNSGIVDFNFQCAVFDQGKEHEILLIKLNINHHIKLTMPPSLGTRGKWTYPG